MLQSSLALTRLSPTKFVSTIPGKAQPGRNATSGGTLMAQSLWAAIRTTDEAFEPSSLHCYFLKAGDVKERITYEVESLRDGRSFAHRQVRALQHKEVIFLATVMLKYVGTTNDSSALSEIETVNYSNRPDNFPVLSKLVPATQLFQSEVIGNLKRYQKIIRPWADSSALDPFVQRFEGGPIEYRFPPDLFIPADFHDTTKVKHLPHLDYYQRVRQHAAEESVTGVECQTLEARDPRFSYVEFTYLSDTYFVLCLTYFHLLPLYCHKFSVSLDHTIHFHKRPNTKAWLAQRLTNPISNENKHIMRGEYYDLDRSPVASVSQEGLVVYENPSSIRARF
ncbi:LADA_0F09692g1_1 [Lachancea dasiensis]|uniref:LADA_0F09692g1_1 n=1 Tax=Lachancea dasiensis TaxID=1072105 RepID=A0A1G4JLK6_9SACH|nr:LADA_0F09692g1_1 [Lachancea dasiensis]